jgi:hypothetical protein
LVEHTLDEVIALMRSAKVPRELKFKRIVPESMKFKLNNIPSTIDDSTSSSHDGILELKAGRQDSLLKIPIKESLFGGFAWCSSYPLYIASPESSQLCQPIFSQELNEIKGSILLIERGGCSFTDKTLNAVQMGVKGLIVLNNPQERSLYRMPAAKSLYSEAATLASIPVVMANYNTKESVDQILEKKYIGGKVLGRFFFGDGCIDDDGTFRPNKKTFKKLGTSPDREEEKEEGGGGVQEQELDLTGINRTDVNKNSKNEDEYLREEEIQRDLVESEIMKQIKLERKARGDRLKQGVGAGVFHLLSQHQEGQLIELEYIAGNIGGSLPLSPLSLYPPVQHHHQDTQSSFNGKKVPLTSSSIHTSNGGGGGGGGGGGVDGEINPLINTTHSFKLVEVNLRKMRANDREIYLNLLQEKEKQVSTEKLTEWEQGINKVAFHLQSIQSSAQQILPPSLKIDGPSTNDKLFEFWKKCGVIEPLHFEPNSAVLIEEWVSSKQSCELIDVLEIVGEYYQPAVIVLLSPYHHHINNGDRNEDNQFMKTTSILQPLEYENRDLSSNTFATPVVRLPPLSSSFLKQYITIQQQHQHQQPDAKIENDIDRGDHLLYVSLSYSSHVERAWEELFALQSKDIDDAWPISEKSKLKAALTLRATHGDWVKFSEKDPIGKVMIETFNPHKKDSGKGGEGNKKWMYSASEYLSSMLSWSIPPGQDPDRACLLTYLWDRSHPGQMMPSRHTATRHQTLPKKKKSSKKAAFEKFITELVEAEDYDDSVLGVNEYLENDFREEL